MRATRVLTSILAAQIFSALIPWRSAQATTLVMLDDELLALKSDLIVEGRVSKIESATRPGSDSVETFITIGVTDLIKGPTLVAELTLRESGGRVGERERWIFGSPDYQVGEQVIAFLERRQDGTLRTAGMTLGKFTVTGGPKSSQQWVQRHLSGKSTMVLDPKGRRTLALDEPRPKEAFKKYLRFLTQHQPRRTALAVRTFTAPVPGSKRARRAEFKLFNNVRWFEPDAGEVVTYETDVMGDASLGSRKSRAAIQAAMAAWSQVPTASIVLLESGTSGPSPISGCDGESKIIFDDPFDEISDPSGCAGVLAVGGYCTRSGKKEVNGIRFRRISEGDITFNNGWGACSFWTQTNLAEVATHELGHTIGLAHSSDSRATMAPYAHFDGRGAGLAVDDEAGVSFIYPRTTAPKPIPDPDDSDADGVPDSTDNCPDHSNSDQADTDGDSVGDACDNCRALRNPDQAPEEACAALTVKRLAVRFGGKRGDTVRLAAKVEPAGNSTLVAMASQGMTVSIVDPAGGEIYSTSVPIAMLRIGRRQRRLFFSDRRGLVLAGLTRLSLSTSRKGTMRLRLAARNLKLPTPVQLNLVARLSLNGIDYAGLAPCRSNRSGSRLTCRERKRRR